jgi:hypothetical protein
VSHRLSLVLVLSTTLGLANSPRQLKSPSRELQGAIDEAIAGQPGTIVVVSVTSQQVLASHNLELASAQLIRPGSTLKPFVVLALLDSGKLDPGQHFLCKRPLYIGNIRMDCSHTTEIAELDADDAIAYSCNSYISQVASRLGPRELVEALRRAGLDSPTGLGKPECCAVDPMILGEWSATLTQSRYVRVARNTASEPAHRPVTFYNPAQTDCSRCVHRAIMASINMSGRAFAPIQGASVAPSFSLCLCSRNTAPPEIGREARQSQPETRNGWRFGEPPES